MPTVVTSAEQWDVLAKTPPKNKEKKVSPDKAIDIYLKGKAAGFEEGKKDFHTTVKQIMNNGIRAAHKHTTEALEYFGDIGVKPASTRLKIVSPFAYEVVFIVSAKVYRSPIMEKVYNHVLDKQNEVKSKGYNIDFFVTHGTSKKAMVDALCHDGFDLEYKEV